MSDRATADRLREYVHVLRGFGLGDGEIVGLHGGTSADEDDVHDVLAEELSSSATDLAALGDRLREALTRSPRGVSLERDHDPTEAFAALEDLLAPYSCDLFVTDASGAELSAVTEPSEPYRIAVTDASDRTRTTTFEFPEGPLGSSNFPALLARVEADVLGDVPLTFVVLAGDDDSWDVALVEDEPLSALRERTGERVEVFGEPLLEPEQPRAMPAEPTADERAATRESVAVDEAVDDAGGIDAVVEALQDTGPDRVVSDHGVDDVLEAIGDDATGPSEDVVAGEGEGIESLLGDLSEVSLDTEDVGGKPDTHVSSEGVDDVIEAVEEVREQRAQARIQVPSTTDVLEASSRNAGEDVSDDSEETLVGGGPDRHVSDQGIDDVFDRIEADEDEAPDAAIEPETEVGTDDEVGEVLDSVDDEFEEASGGLDDVGGGPTRHVSSDSLPTLEDVPGASADEDEFEWASEDVPVETSAAGDADRREEDEGPLGEAGEPDGVGSPGDADDCGEGLGEADGEPSDDPVEETNVDGESDRRTSIGRR